MGVVVDDFWINFSIKFLFSINFILKTVFVSLHVDQEIVCKSSLIVNRKLQLIIFIFRKIFLE